MRKTLLLVTAVLVLAVAALAGIRAFSKHESTPVPAVALQPLVEPVTAADRLIRLAESKDQEPSRYDRRIQPAGRRLSAEGS